MIETLYSIFEKYGWTGLCIGALMVCLYFLIVHLGKKLTKNMDSGMEKIAQAMTTNMANQNEKLVESIGKQNEKLIDFFIHNKTSEQLDHNNKLNERMQISQVVNDRIKDIMYYMKSDRVIILEFHNSNQNLSGVPFAKYSCTYEWFKRGVQPLSSKCTNMSFSSISSVVCDMQNEELHQKIYENIEVIAEVNPSLYGLLDEINCVAIIYNGLYDMHNNLIGLLGVEYHKPLPKNISKELVDLEHDASTLSSILNLKIHGYG
jgi:hypothetical protein